MNWWEWSKITGGVSLALAVALGGAFMGGQLVQTDYPDQPAYKIADMKEAPVDLASVQRGWPGSLSEIQESRVRGYLAHIEQAVVPEAAQGGPVQPRQVADLGTLLAAADPERGASVAKVCQSCHTFDQGGGARTGPNLWSVVGRDIASAGGFAYSPAATAAPGTWTYEQLDAFLASPSRAMPGTKMAFNGVRRPEDRAHLIAYLATLGSAPPFPTPSPPAATDTAAAGGGGGRAAP